MPQGPYSKKRGRSNTIRNSVLYVTVTFEWGSTCRIWNEFMRRCSGTIEICRYTWRMSQVNAISFIRKTNNSGALSACSLGPIRRVSFHKMLLDALQLASNTTGILLRFPLGLLHDGECKTNHPQEFRRWLTTYDWKLSNHAWNPNTVDGHWVALGASEQEIVCPGWL